MNKLCKHKNCKRKALYGLTRDNPIKCKSHKNNMKLCSTICKCGKHRPYFNNLGETIAIYCSECKTKNMIDVIHKKCKCGKSIPSFNEPEEIIPICCSECKTETMVGINRKKCKCGKSRPCFNNPGEKKAICCFECKTETMINILEKRCRCGKHTPYFNNPGETIAICCSECKTKNMINIKNKKCKCGKSIPSFNEPNKTAAICCFECKTETMIYVIHKKCKCGKSRPCFNNPGKTVAICCSECKTENMIDVINKKCNGIINNDKTKSKCPYERFGNSKYNYYCTDCFKYNFPLDPLTFKIRKKSKEIMVRDFINKNFGGFQHDKPLSTSHCDCTVRRRIDHRKLIENTLLVIETDENQHKSYDKMNEETRYDDLYMAYSGKWIYIRFNPDPYKCKNGKTKNPRMTTRLENLKLEIEKQIKRIKNEDNKELVERIYMYYNE
jgi:hypothetical protein